MDSTRLLRWGLISTARISADVIPGLQRSEKNELVAVASRSRSAAEDFARRNDIPRIHASYEALLQDPDIDCVYLPPAQPPACGVDATGDRGGQTRAVREASRRRSF